MANKYRAESKAAQARRRAERSCERKHRYATEAEAQQKGQTTYACPLCNGWHRSGSLGRLVARVRGRR